MTPMIERVARAIQRRRLQPDWETVENHTWVIDHDLELAKAALEALREPTEEMVKSAAETPGIAEINSLIGFHAARTGAPALRWPDRGEEAPIIQAWKAMIDTALERRNG